MRQWRLIGEDRTAQCPRAVRAMTLSVVLMAAQFYGRPAANPDETVTASAYYNVS
jgi:hypothetical protein